MCTRALSCTRAAQRIAAAIRPFETWSAVSHNHKEPVFWWGSGQLYGTGATSTSRQAAADTCWNRTLQQPKHGWWEARDQDPWRRRTFPGADPGVKFSRCPSRHLGKWEKKKKKSEILVSNNCTGFSPILGLENILFALSEVSDTSQRAGLYRADATDKSVQPAIFRDHALEEYKNNMGSEAM